MQNWKKRKTKFDFELWSIPSVALGLTEGKENHDSPNLEREENHDSPNVEMHRRLWECITETKVMENIKSGKI